MSPGGEDQHAEKAALRTRLLAARASLGDPARREASAAICRRLAELAELRGCRAVLAYAAFGAEVDVDPYVTTLLDAGAGVFFPWVEGDDLGVARVRDLTSDLAHGWRGVREPRASGRRPARPDRLDAALVPGVAFDLQGNRLGYGGGHFDRLLARLRPDAVTVGVCFAEQVVDGIPVEPQDRAVDVVVTEREVLRTR